VRGAAFRPKAARLQLLCAARHGPKPTTDQTLANDNNIPKAFNARVFIAAFMIAHYPRSIFEIIEESQQAVIDTATSLLLAFEQLCKNRKTHKDFVKVPDDLTKDFGTLLHAYAKAFKTCKVCA
jgi:hypothetical protein